MDLNEDLCASAHWALLVYLELATLPIAAQLEMPQWIYWHPHLTGNILVKPQHIHRTKTMLHSDLL